jgi:hypothetical protein
MWVFSGNLQLKTLKLTVLIEHQIKGGFTSGGKIETVETDLVKQSSFKKTLRRNIAGGEILGKL